MSEAAAGSYKSLFAGLGLGLRRNGRSMLFTFVSTTALFGGVALLMPPVYKAEAVLMVRLGQEYLVNGDPASTTLYMERQEIGASEAAMLQTPQLAKAVIEKIGLSRIYSKLAAGIDPSDPSTSVDAMERAVAKFRKALTVLPVKDSTLFDVSFKNADPQVASDVLADVLDGYLHERRHHFEYGGTGALGGQLTQAVQTLQRASDDLEAIKRVNGITDIDLQLSKLFDERADLVKARNEAQIDMADKAAKVAALAPLANRTDLMLTGTTTMPGPRLNAVSEEVARLRLQRDSLLVTFKTGTPQIEDINTHIAAAEALMHVLSGDQSVQKVMSRPLEYEALTSNWALGRAALDGATQRAQAAASKLAEVGAAIAELDGARALYEVASRQKKAAEDAYFQASKRVTESRAHDDMMETVRPNVEIVQAPEPPYHETWLRVIVAASGVVLGLLITGTILYLDDVRRNWRTQ